MAITREKKEQLVEDLKERLGSTEVVILTDFRGLTVPAQQELRNKLREADSDYQVVKNTLTKIALEQIDRPVPEAYLNGPTALTYLHGDIAGPAKALLDFARDTGELTIKGGILGNRIVDADAVKKLADLPPREILLAQLLGTIQSPGTNLARTLQAPATNLVRTLNAAMRDLMMTMQAYVNQQQAGEA